MGVVRAQWRLDGSQSPDRGTGTVLFTVLAIWEEREVCACAKNNQSCSFWIWSGWLRSTSTLSITLNVTMTTLDQCLYEPKRVTAYSDSSEGQAVCKRRATLVIRPSQCLALPLNLRLST